MGVLRAGWTFCFSAVHNARHVLAKLLGLLAFVFVFVPVVMLSSLERGVVKEFRSVAFGEIHTGGAWVCACGCGCDRG